MSRQLRALRERSDEPRHLADLAQIHITNELLCQTLEASVPFRILELHRQGGPTQTDWDEAIAFGERLAYEGDALLYQGSKGQTASMAAGLIRALAVAAFLPGGVTIAGLCFAAGVPDRVGDRRISPAWLTPHLEQTDAR